MTHTRRQSTVMRRLLLCSVLLGLITMHHVVNQHVESEGTSAPHTVQQVVADSHPDNDGSSAPAQDSATALAQLCLAVLAGSVVLLISVMLIRRVRDALTRVGSLRTRPGGGGDPSTPPVPAVDGFSHALCVLRL